jgi:hypothetical protein
MMKKLICAATFTLAFTYSLPTFAGGILRDAKAPHLVHRNAHPNNARVPVTHHFEVHVQGSDLSQLSVDVPENIKLSDRIVVTDRSGKKVDTNVSTNDRKVTIAFTQPVPNGTNLSVSMKDVKTRSLQGRTWVYPVYGRNVGINADVPIGIARIQTYR